MSSLHHYFHTREVPGLLLDQETGIPGNPKILQEFNRTPTHVYYDRKRIATECRTVASCSGYLQTRFAKNRSVTLTLRGPSPLPQHKTLFLERGTARCTAGGVIGHYATITSSDIRPAFPCWKRPMPYNISWLSPSTLFPTHCT
jgi:hypothetical protein